MRPTDIKIISMPTQVQWRCPYCGNIITMTYEHFCTYYGVSQWQYRETECMACGETYYFNSEIKPKGSR